MSDYDAIIVGGGAAGLFVSIILGRARKKVLLIEKNKILGKKLLITGKGRCNVTNNSEVDEVLKNIPHNSKFLYSALYSFTPHDTMSFFEDLNVPLKTERGNRVFPVSDKSSDIVDALTKEIKKLGIKVLKSNVKELIIENNKCIGIFCDDGKYLSDNVIIATGGKSYKSTGSTGDGYKFAEKADLSVTDIYPSLVPLKSNDNFVKELMGLSLRNVTLSLFEEGKKKPVYRELGEMIFTHFGISGPLVLSASAVMNSKKQENYYVNIDLKPGLDENQLDRRILRDFSDNPNRDFQNVLPKLLPSKLVPVVVKLSGIEPDEKVNNISKEKRRDLVSLLKNFKVNISGLCDIDEAIITRGGISIKEINPSSMETKKYKGLYFIGEVLDVDAYTGGFNLQIAFSTASLCANTIIENNRREND